jgi:hypothetical protein
MAFPPTVPSDIQTSLQTNNLYPAFAHEMQRSEFLDELPPLQNYEFHLSQFSLYASTSYFINAEVICGTLLSSYLSLNNEYEALKLEIKKFKEETKVNTDLLNEEEHEYALTRHYRQLDNLNMKGDYLDDIKIVSEQGFIVQLWSFNEKFMSRIMKIFSNQLELQFSIPSRWDKVLSFLSDVEINLLRIPKIYYSYDELRVLNNKIKHLGEVDEKLSEFSYFSGKEGEKLEAFTFELQRYLDSSYAFITFLAQELFIRANDEELKQNLLAMNKYTLSS